jgi:hypothetical protein
VPVLLFSPCYELSFDSETVDAIDQETIFDVSSCFMTVRIKLAGPQFTCSSRLSPFVLLSASLLQIFFGYARLLDAIHTLVLCASQLRCMRP